MKEFIIILLIIYLTTPVYNTVITITDKNFKKEHSSNSKTKLLLVAYSNSCPHCHDFLPKFSKLSEKLKDKAVFGKVNVEEETEIGTNFNIRFVPALLLLIKDQYYEFGEEEKSDKNIKEFIEHPDEFGDPEDIPNYENSPLLS